MTDPLNFALSKSEIPSHSGEGLCTPGGPYSTMSAEQVLVQRSGLAIEASSPISCVCFLCRTAPPWPHVLNLDHIVNQSLFNSLIPLSPILLLPSFHKSLILEQADDSPARL